MATLTPAFRAQRAVARLLLRDAAAAFLAVCLTLLCFEIYFNLAGTHYPASIYTSDVERGYAFRPSAHGWWINESRLYLRINSHGYHDHEHPRTKAAGVIRIAAVGSSYVSENDVAADKNVVSVLQSTLNSRLGPKSRVETFNFGVNAYCPVQSFYTLQRDVWQTHPDIVLFFLTNVDILDTCRRVAYNKQFKDRPFFEVDKNGNVVPDEISRLVPPPNPARVEADDRRKDFFNHSDLALAVREAIEKTAAKMIRTPPDPPTPYQSIYHYPQALMFLPPPRNGPMEQAWQVLEALVPKIKRAAIEHSAELWIIPVGTIEQESPDPKVREEFRSLVGADDLYYYDKRVALIAQQDGVPCLRIAPLMAAYGEQNHVYLHGSFFTPPGQGHWNDLGNAQAANFIADSLMRSSSALHPSQ